MNLDVKSATIPEHTNDGSQPENTDTGMTVTLKQVRTPVSKSSLGGSTVADLDSLSKQKYIPMKFLKKIPSIIYDKIVASVVPNLQKETAQDTCHLNGDEPLP